MDTPSNDFGQSKTFRTHRILAANNWPGYENVNNLDKLKARGFMIIISPLKLVKGTGAPATIFAFDSKWNVASRANISFNFCGFTLLLVAVLHIMSRV